MDDYSNKLNDKTLRMWCLSSFNLHVGVLLLSDSMNWCSMSIVCGVPLVIAKINVYGWINTTFHFSTPSKATCVYQTLINLNPHTGKDGSLYTVYNGFALIRVEPVRLLEPLKTLTDAERWRDNY